MNGPALGNPVEELKRFYHAALVQPVERDHQQSDAQFRHRRIVAVVTLVVGATALAFSIRIEPGDPTFYFATLGVAAVWAVGALASGPLHLGRAHKRSGEGTSRAVLQSVILGLSLLAIFTAGSFVVSKVDFLRGTVNELLDHARFGSLALVMAITAINGITEEMYFRGALFAAIGRKHPVVISSAVYTLAVLPLGVPLLAFAALVLGLVVGLQRRVTGGILGPTIIHLIWSLGMLLVLPPVLAIGT